MIISKKKNHVPHEPVDVHTSRSYEAHEWTAFLRLQRACLCKGSGEVSDQKGVPAAIRCALLLDLVLTSSASGDSKGSKTLLDS
jgi:hypothetical protein